MEGCDSYILLSFKINPLKQISFAAAFRILAGFIRTVPTGNEISCEKQKAAELIRPN